MSKKRPTYADDINNTLKTIMRENQNVYIIGEDLLDPYGGAFKVTSGLSTEFPERVITTPISEPAIVGLAGGMALRGLLPIVEIMFGDFITLATDQIINHITKYNAMYNGQVKCPVIIRTPMGGGRGYGPTHSQSLEKLFFGTPYLNIIAPSHFHSPGELLYKIINTSVDPTLFIEHKLLYPQKLFPHSEINSDLFINRLQNDGLNDLVEVRNFNQGSPDILIISYGGMSRIIEIVLKEMAQEEVNVSSVFPSNLNNFDLDFLDSLIKGVKNILIIEEGTEGFGWGAEISVKLYEKFDNIKIYRISSYPSIIPAVKSIEEEFLPNVTKINSKIVEVLLNE